MASIARRAVGRENYCEDLVSGFCWRGARNARQHLGGMKKISR
jgi:hypothetical protein